MKVIKFSLNEDYYNQLKVICDTENLTLKRKINILLAQDTGCINLKEYYPLDYKEKPKKLTLKVNEELYKGVMKNCGKLDVRVKEYIPYLIYRYLYENKSKNE